MDKNGIFKMVQEHLKSCPLIIWGSGATIPFGMPSMSDLKSELKITEKGNLEEILSRINDENKQSKYEQDIFNIINQKDTNFRNSLWANSQQTNHVKQLIHHFYDTHPQVINIITTNYDCVLEYLFSYHKFPYSDGFSGKEFAQFEESNFKTKEHINLYKVHGSLRWSRERYSYYNDNMDGIFPSNQKYQKVSQEPYRTIITEADQAITNAKCFLCIGFGFNDDHITPKIETAIVNSKPIVVIAKKPTESAIAKLKKASNYILVEESEQDKTKFTYKKHDQKEKEEILEGNYWELEKFNQVLGVN